MLARNSYIFKYYFFFGRSELAEALLENILDYIFLRVHVHTQIKYEYGQIFVLDI